MRSFALKRSRIAIVGDYGAPTHPATKLALAHLEGVEAEWIPTANVSDDPAEVLAGFHGIWACSGQYNDFEGALRAIRFAREHNVPFIGTCAGFQYGVLEFARNVMGWTDASHAEQDRGQVGRPVIIPFECTFTGERHLVRPSPGTRTAALYDTLETEEIFHCNFRVNPAYLQDMENHGMRVSGVDAGGDTRMIELETHPFYVLTLFVLQADSTPEAPHPVLAGFREAVLKFQPGVWTARADE